ncbi:MAG: carbohydrate kinase family protein [Asgard group archaeon]|nr:carbohydrate kinase family protein [Asgard group archaeon]
MILTIGNINVDLICSVPYLPAPDDKIVVSDLSIVPGGGACNFAVGLARLNMPVALFGHVGDDRNGRIGLESLINEGIDISRVKIESELPTGFVIILVEPKGQSIKIGYREANALLSPDEIDFDILNEITHIHVSSVSEKIAKKTAAICNSLNITTSIDLGAELMALSSETITEIINDYSIVFMNKIGFKRAFSEEISKSAIQKAQEGQYKILNVTMGEEGSYIITQNEVIKIPSWEVEVIDTTGAGDAYAAGFIFKYLKSASLLESGKFAAACAALQITEANARDGMPRINQVEAFIKNHSNNKY